MVVGILRFSEDDLLLDPSLAEGTLGLEREANSGNIFFLWSCFALLLDPACNSLAFPFNMLSASSVFEVLLFGKNESRLDFPLAFCANNLAFSNGVVFSLRPGEMTMPSEALVRVVLRGLKVRLDIDAFNVLPTFKKDGVIELSELFEFL